MSDRGRKRISEQRPGATSALAIMVLLLMELLAVPAAQAQSSFTMTPLYDFQGGTDGDYPRSGLVEDPLAICTVPPAMMPQADRRRFRRSFRSESEQQYRERTLHLLS